MDIESLEPTIVLVHGAIEDSLLWAHGVIQRLQRDGYPVKVFSNPLLGVAVALSKFVIFASRRLRRISSYGRQSQGFSGSAT
jgi:hypothetical protein